MAAKDRSIYELFTIKSNDGSKTIDLRGAIVAFSYFENVFSPMLTAQVIVATTGNVIADEDGDMTSIYNGLPLRGGEKVSIKIPANSGNNVDFVSRYFAPNLGIKEDPVTGFIHTILSPYWAKVKGKYQFSCYQASARGGELMVTVKETRILIQGHAVKVFETEINI